MVQNPVVGSKGLVGNDFRHDGRQGGIQLIGLFPAKQLGEIALGICVNKENFLPCRERPMARLAAVVVFPTLCEASHNVGYEK